MNGSHFSESMYRSRENQAEKILKILDNYRKSNLHSLSCLDVGCSTGEMNKIFRFQFRKVVGFDINEKLIRKAKLSDQGDESVLLVADAGNVPFPDESFDVVVCAQIYEHTQNQNSLSSEIWRVLNKNGFCFFSGPNRLFFIEQHYRLPFISWLPHRWANLYMRVFRKGEKYDIYPLNYWQLRKLFANFLIFDYTEKILCQPEQFGLYIKNPLIHIYRHLPRWLRASVSLLVPNFNWILVKPGI